jgi:hypothetical protein
MATATEINTYHKRLVSALNEETILGQKAALRAGVGQDWKSEKFEGKVDFELYPLDIRLVGASERRRDVPIFAFEKISIVGRELEEITDKAGGARCWIGWHEQWERFAPSGLSPGKKGKQPYFMLAAIQWILFWGQTSDDTKVQVMRAEWDNVAHVTPHRKSAMTDKVSDEGDNLAGQPHWHVDPLLEVGDVSLLDLFKGDELEEEFRHELSGKYLKLQRVHLAMAGWQCPARVKPVKTAPKSQHDAHHASRWQVDYTEDKDTLIDWNLSVVRYIKSQINYIREF